IALAVDDYRGVLVERDRGAVVAPERLPRANDNRLHDLTFLDRGLRCGLLDRPDDDVAHARVAPLRSALDANAEELPGAGVVGDAQSGFLLDHLAASTISTSRQFFLLESGRVSTIRTTSPTFARFSGSCAWNLTLRRTTFLYFVCALTRSTLTTIVLSIALETTTPRRSWRSPRSETGFGSRVIGLRPAGRSRFGFGR